MSNLTFCVGADNTLDICKNCVRNMFTKENTNEVVSVTEFKPRESNIQGWTCDYELPKVNDAR